MSHLSEVIMVGDCKSHFCCRDIIRNAVNASEHDAVIFVGSGTTGAVHKLIHSLDLRHTPVSYHIYLAIQCVFLYLE